jgi:hypothetical protein
MLELMKGELPAVPVQPAAEVVDLRPGVFDLSDAELRQAERLLPEREGLVLRNRVMAFRLYKAGNYASAARLRAKADKIEAEIMTRKVA